jgi:hypothetical protein
MIKHEYKTSDLNLATTLCCLGFQVIDLDRSNPKRILFVFNDSTNSIKECESQYWSNQIKLSPAQLFLHQKSLKQRIFSSHD